jgi:hypothetical protein
MVEWELAPEGDKAGCSHAMAETITVQEPEIRNAQFSCEPTKTGDGRDLAIGNPLVAVTSAP